MNIFRAAYFTYKTLKSDYHLYRLTKPCINACCDKLSKDIIYARINYYSEFLRRFINRIPLLDTPLLRYHKTNIKLTNPTYRIDELEQFSGKRIVLIGEGYELEYNQSVLNHSNWKAHYCNFGDNLSKLKNLTSNDVVIPCKLYDYISYANQLQKEYPNINIYIPEGGLLLLAYTGNQYFDFFEPKENEIFVDCGAYDGKTEVEILQWGGRNISKIYAFELDPINKNKCLETYKMFSIEDKVVFFNKGTSNSNTTVHLSSSSLGSTGSTIGNGDISAELVKIDDTVKDKISFIKMDVEGAELDSLKGAEESIMKYKPRLAICIYHKQSDIYEIPNYLLSIVPDYKFAIRQYAANEWECVLYAYVENDKRI